MNPQQQTERTEPMRVYEFAYSFDAPISGNKGIVSTNAPTLDTAIDQAIENLGEIIDNAGGDSEEGSITLEFRSVTVYIESANDEDDESDEG